MPKDDSSLKIQSKACSDAIFAARFQPEFGKVFPLNQQAFTVKSASFSLQVGKAFPLSVLAFPLNLQAFPLNLHPLNRQGGKPDRRAGKQTCERRRPARHRARKQQSGSKGSVSEPRAARHAGCALHNRHVVLFQKTMFDLVLYNVSPGRGECTSCRLCGLDRFRRTLGNAPCAWKAGQDEASWRVHELPVVRPRSLRMRSREHAASIASGGKPSGAGLYELPVVRAGSAWTHAGKCALSALGVCGLGYFERRTLESTPLRLGGSGRQMRRGSKLNRSLVGTKGLTSRHFFRQASAQRLHWTQSAAENSR